MYIACVVIQKLSFDCRNILILISGRKSESLISKKYANHNCIRASRVCTRGDVNCKIAFEENV